MDKKYVRKIFWREKIGRKKSENFLDCNNFSPHHPLRLNVPVPKGGKTTKKSNPIFSDPSSLPPPTSYLSLPFDLPNSPSFSRNKKICP
jgi:hypothetical protein